MTHSTSRPRADRPTSGALLVQRGRLFSAMAVGALVFWYFGWRVARPVDPEGAVSLLMLGTGQGVVCMAELLALAVVVSGLAVAICGAGSAERGPLAVAVGLAALAMHGGQMDQLVQYRLTTTGPDAVITDPFPVWALVSETWLWLALIGVGFVVGRWVEGWFNSARVERRKRDPAQDNDFRQGVGTVALASLIAWLIVLSATGSPELPTLKGQLFFALITAFLVASLFAHWFFRVETRVWTLVAVALVATLAYVYGQPDAETIRAASRIGARIPLSPVARPLPIEFAALGSIGVLFEADIMALFCAILGLGPVERTPADDTSQSA
ncbi:MAG: hypothetical protein ACE5E1_05900 [Phycisphaerae bacterium]